MAAATAAAGRENSAAGTAAARGYSLMKPQYH